MYYHSSQDNSYLPGDIGGEMAIFDKNTTLFVFAVYKHQKRRVSLKSQSQFCTYSYRRAQLMDDDCLATPDPTTSIFLYWINTNRMGTAKNDFLQCFYIKKTFKKNKIYTWVSSHFQNGHDKCIFRYSGNFFCVLPDCPGKRTAQKYLYMYICNNTNN